MKTNSNGGFLDAVEYGFSPESSGFDNTEALQKAVDHGGTIIVSTPGTYRIAGTVLIGSNTSLYFGKGVFLEKVAEKGDFTHVFLNKGALTKTVDQNISIDGLHIIVNGIDKVMDEIYGLRGQIAFFYIRDLKITGFRCLDLASAQFAIHICTFEDIIIDDVIIKGNKDGVHLGRGKRFTIRNGVFQTFDDAIALNAHDYATSNPELGWIENGVIQNCHDLACPEKDAIGFFCRILAGGWINWKAGMEVQHSDSVISNGRLYRVQAQPDGAVYQSHTQPTHESGTQTLDGINWGVVQNDVTYTAGVRNVVFRDIFLEKPRTSFSIHFDIGRYSRSYYPGAEIPIQEQILLDNIRVLHPDPVPLLHVATPVDVLSITNSCIRNNRIDIVDNKAMDDFLSTTINISNTVFNQKGPMNLLTNHVNGKKLLLKTKSSVAVHADFSATVKSGKGQIQIQSDLPGL